MSSSTMASPTSKNSHFKIVLGSSSPARREILADMGYEFTVMSADIDERAIRREKPEDLVKALAEAKAEAIKLKLHGEDISHARDQPTILITSDQVMVSKGMIRERPKSQEEAEEFIKGYSGDKAYAVNYVLVTNLNNGASKGGWDIPKVASHAKSALQFCDHAHSDEADFDPAEFVLISTEMNYKNHHICPCTYRFLQIYFHHIPDEFIQNVVKLGEMTFVAGGLKLTHSSVLPFIKQLVVSAQRIAFEDFRGSSLRSLSKNLKEQNKRFASRMSL
uniref:Maf-like protein n=1 Tax=Leersia perrieri TaxID=77586 RepID=A0A0D9VYF4_9ORYZ